MKQQNTITYHDWTDEIAEMISAKLQCGLGDAFAIIQANRFTISQCWGKDLTPEETASQLTNL